MPSGLSRAAMANPIQQGLKLRVAFSAAQRRQAAMANPIQQGLKHAGNLEPVTRALGRNG